MNTLKQRFMIAAVAAAVTLPGTVQAALYLPGGSPLVGDLLTAALPGTVVSTARSAVNSGGYTGSATAAVVDGPEAGPNLDFYYHFVGQAAANAAPGLTLQLATSGSTAQTTLYAPGNASASNSFDQVTGFEVSLDGSTPGTVGYLVRIRTAATAFQNAFGLAGAPGLATAQSNAPGASGGPLAMVVSHAPEPGTLALFGASLLAMGGIARRRIR